MKKKIALMLIFTLSLCACGSNSVATLGGADKEHVMTWQEQYDLGVRYLSEVLQTKVKPQNEKILRLRKKV